jgi:hypothetical protein
VKNKLDLDEISDWQTFEGLLTDYFREVKEERNIKDITVEASGEGSDGGRDILVTFRITDSIIAFERKWVVQCKYYQRAVSKSDLSTINIPTLIHEYNANGYLLVCRGMVTSGVTDMFENLRDKCKMGYSYMIWTGSDLVTQLLLQPPQPLIQKYFPEYYEFLTFQERRNEEK